MIKNFVLKILFAANYLMILLFQTLIVFSIMCIIFDRNDAWVSVLFVVSIILVYIIRKIIKIIKTRPKKLDINNFMPSKPEKDGIRYLRGKRAKEFEEAWETTSTYLAIGKFRQFILEIRLFIINLTGLTKDYFSERHRYDPRSRRALDRFALTNYELRMKHKSDWYYSGWRKFFFKYLKFKYRKDDKRFKYWICITIHGKRPIYFWHEDTEKYEKVYNVHKRTDEEQDEIERRMIA